MAGQVPSVAPPAYADSMGQNFAQAAEQRGNILGMELENNSRNLGHILSNLERIANVSGGELTPDRLLAAYAGSKEDILDDNYTRQADDLRTTEQQSRINANNRRGTGGGGGNEPDAPNVRVLDEDGNVLHTDTVKHTDLDEFHRQWSLQHPRSRVEIIPSTGNMSAPPGVDTGTASGGTAGTSGTTPETPTPAMSVPANNDAERILIQDADAVGVPVRRSQNGGLELQVGDGTWHSYGS